MQYNKRLTALRNIMRVQGLDAFWITKLENCQYLSGFHSHNRLGVSLLVTAKNSFAVSNSLYLEALEDEEIEAIQIIENLPNTIRNLCRRQELSKVGFEADDHTYGFMEKMLRDKTEVRFVDSTGLVEKLRVAKDDDEIATLQQACTIADTAFGKCLSVIRPGMTELELAWKVEQLIRAEGAEDVAFRPLIIAAGKNSSRAHHFPGTDVFKKGDLIQLDIGARYQGYGSDLSRVVSLGRPVKKVLDVFSAVREAQRYAIEQVKAGKQVGEIDKQTRLMLDRLGYPAYPHGLGHGVGLALDVHEAPLLLNHGHFADISLEERMTITIEPAVYLPGEFGIRLEDVVLVGKEQARKLSTSSQDLVII